MRLILAAMLLAVLPAAAGTKPPIASAARLAGDDHRTRFVADLSQPVSYTVYVLPDPFRVIIDLPALLYQLPPGSGDEGGGLISGYRYGLLEDNRSRIVLDATGPVLIEKSYIVKPEGDQPARIVVDLVKTDLKTFTRNQAAEASETAADVVAEPQQEVPPDPIDYEVPPSNQPPPQAEATLTQGTIAPLPQQKPGSGAAAAGQRPQKPARHDGRRVIVIDPGHGGIDSGAVGVNRTREKDVVLNFAFALRQALRASGRYEVAMTRDDDSFVTLKQRVHIAREKQADLFIAIHADTVRGASVRGATLYTVSDKASDAEAEALAQKENRADAIAGMDLGDEKEEVADILIELTQRETKNHSLFFARKALAQLKPVTQMTGRPLRGAGFVVLKAPDVPSVLLELGYLSSKADEKLLNSPVWRATMASALGKAIDTYFSTEIAARQ
ncbi:N-acetylmuramoyl-L-alanine amidase [soil metagenome]